MSNHFQPYQFGPSYQSSAPIASEDYGFPIMPQRPFQHSSNANPMQPQTSLPGIPALPKTVDLAQGVDRQNGSFNTFTGSNDFLSHVNTNGSTMYDAQVPSAFNSLLNNSANPSVDMYHPSQPTLNPMSTKPNDRVMADPTPRHRTPNDTDMRNTVGSRSRNGDQELEDGEINTSTVSEPDRFHLGPNNAQTTLDPTTGYEYRIWNSQQESKRLIQQLTAWGLGIQEILAEVTESKALESLGREMGFQVGSEARTSPKPQNVLSGNATNRLSPSLKPQILTTADGAMEGQNANVSTAERGAEPSHDQHSNNDSSVNVAHEAKPMDRKALIAQKLAARNVKPSPSPSNGVPPKQILGRVTEQSLVIKPARMDGNSTKKEVEPSPPIRSPERPQRDLEATRKFQTDLARQRMAALKQKALVKQNQPFDPALQQSEHLGTPVLKATHMRTGDPSMNPIELPRMSNPQSPTRRESYFSPVSQTPMFNIPGLFSMPQTATKPQIYEPTVRPSEVPSLLTQQGPLTDAVSSEALPKQANEAETVMPASDSSSGHPPQNPRKRRRADDFFDSPPNRSKKSLMRADEDVVIDISDDEHSPSNDSHVLDSADGPDTIEKSFADQMDPLRQPVAEGSNSPMNALAQGEVPTALLSEGTPFGSLLAKTAESNGLKTKEMEIESMNRKIAELEANIKARKAKQAASRTQSPGGIASVTPAEMMEGAIEAVSIFQEPDFTENEPSAEESTMEEDSAIKLVETLDAPGHSAPNGSSIQPSPLGNPSDSPQPSEVHTKLDKDLSIDKISTSLPVSDSGKHTQSEFGTNDQDVEVRIERRSVEAPMPPSDVHQRRASRRLEIQSGLPILDQEIEKRRKQLELIRAQEVEIQADIQRGVEGRRMLLDELSRLSDILDSMDWKTDGASPQRTEDQVQCRSAEGDHKGSYRGISLPTDTAQQAGHGDMQAFENYIESRPENQPLSDVSRVSQHDPEPGLPNTANAVFVNEHNEILDGDLDGDNMDISRSSLDEGEIEESINNANLGQSEQGSELSDHEQSLNGSIPGKGLSRIKTASAEPDDSTTFRQEHHSTIDLTGDLDEGSTGQGDESDGTPRSEGLEMYEPPDELSGAGFSRTDQHSPNVQEYQSGASPNFTEDRASVQIDPRKTTNIMIEDTHISSDSEDSDGDYEPAEPSAEEMDFHERSPQSATEQVILPPSSPDANNKDITNADELREHFEPYQSPLEKFRSYRYHPEYLSKVPSGFRSLTYSNAIDAETPICQYDLDGTCNDVSCRKQHFGKMNLSDDSILRDLARLDGASAEDQDRFLTGLKTLISDLRTRKVASMSDIATSIAEYRKQFLGDESRLLSL